MVKLRQKIIQIIYEIVDSVTISTVSFISYLRLEDKKMHFTLTYINLRPLHLHVKCLDFIVIDFYFISYHRKLYIYVTCEL